MRKEIIENTDGEMECVNWYIVFFLIIMIFGVLVLLKEIPNEEQIKEDSFIVLNNKEISKIEPYVRSTIIYYPETSEIYGIVMTGDCTKLLPLLDQDGNVKKYNDTDNKENNLVILSIQEISSTLLYILYDPETSVMYNIVYGSPYYKVAPMYNEDGSVKLYNKEGRKIKEYKEIEETEGTKKIKTIREIEEYKEIKKTKLNKILDRIFNVIDNIKNILD